MRIWQGVDALVVKQAASANLWPIACRKRCALVSPSGLPHLWRITPVCILFRRSNKFLSTCSSLAPPEDRREQSVQGDLRGGTISIFFPNNASSLSTTTARNHVAEPLVPHINIHTVARSIALATAKFWSPIPWTSSDISIWVDASFTLENVSSVGVAYIPDFVRPHRWEQRSICATGIHNVGEAELLAVEHGLKIALDEICMRHKEGGAVKQKVTVRVFSDSVAALRRTIQKVSNSEVDVQTYLARLSQHNVDIQLRWVPGHSGVVGNLRAHQAAKSGRNSISKSGS